LYHILEETRNAYRILVENFFEMITWKIIEVGGRDCMEIGCEDWRRMELSQDHVQ
jgi:hypothetical protein